MVKLLKGLTAVIVFINTVFYTPVITAAPEIYPLAEYAEQIAIPSIVAVNAEPRQIHFADTEELTAVYADAAVKPEQRHEPVESEPDPETWISLGMFRISHYCVEEYQHICNAGLPLRTASGTTPSPYSTLAVDTSLIPFGSRVRIGGGDTVYTAEDTGGAIKGKRIDVCVTGHDEALRLGVYEAEVFVLEVAP